MQPSQYIAGARVAARKTSLVHRDSVGLLDGARSHTVSVGDRHPLLGEVLRFESSRRMVGVHCTYTCADCLPGVRHTLLSVTNDTQVRGDGVRHPRARDTQGADGARSPGA